MPAGSIPDIIRKIQIGSMSAFVGIQFATGHAQRFESAFLQAKVEITVCILLNRKSILFEKSEVLDQFRRLVKVDENANPAALGGIEYGAEKPGQIEWRKLTVLGMEKDVFVQIIREGSFGRVEHMPQG